MIITFDRPMFISNKYLDIYSNEKWIGKMRYWQHDIRHIPEYDVNIEMVGSDRHLEILQESFTMSEGNQWDLLEKDTLIANINSGTVKELDQVEAQFQDGTTLLVKPEGLFKSEVQVFIDDNLIGEASPKGLFFNRYYEIKLNDYEVAIDPILLAGITYAFFSISNLD